MRTDSQPDMQRLSDESLAARVSRGDSAALETLYDRHGATVLGLALRIVGERTSAEDIVQETFWRVWKSAVSYQPQRGPFVGWLCRITRNLAIDLYRRRNVRPAEMYGKENSVSVLDTAPDPKMDVAAQAQSELENKQIQNALSSLPGVQRQVIELAYFYGMTRQEIAEATGEALGTVHTRARLALQKLREELDNQEFEG